MSFTDEFDLLQSRYQIRYAAGIYWLLDMEQSGYPYKKPLPLNEMGARIWEKLEEGGDSEQISVDIAKEYGVSEVEALEDIQEFCEQLRRQGIQI